MGFLSFMLLCGASSRKRDPRFCRMAAGIPWAWLLFRDRLNALA
jgi:hypothetical protein